MRSIVFMAALWACSLSLSAATETASPRSRESFNSRWQFARFGLMADGSRTPEPGNTEWAITAKASSEESANPAGNAIDGDPATRWCAAGAQPKQSLTLDLASPRSVGQAEIQWEFPDTKYQAVTEASLDEKQWKPLPATARFVRVRITAVPANKWASIREIHLKDADGKPIVNTRSAAAGQSPELPAFNDSAWRTLDIPHDWAIEGPFRYDLEGNTGKLPWRGIGWYRKHFTPQAADQGKRLFIDFDGAMANAKVWLNGEYLGTWPYGYNSFRMELTDHLKFGQDNVLAVRLDTEHWGSRWYPGAGLYRNVWLVKTSPIHVGHWGTYITTPEVTDASAAVKLVVTLDNQGAAAKPSVRTDIYELAADGTTGPKVASSPDAALDIPANGSASATLQATVANPKRWDITSPQRYLARTLVSVGGTVVDSYDTPFGIRTIEFTARDGFKLNGRRVPLYGTCNHHDLGALGAAINTRALERQLEIIKSFGDNALRTSHNPPAPELLDLADRMGFLVMDEAFDCWEHGKTGNDYARLYAEWHTKDLQAMVRRDRNHPSVVMWSTGNEIHEQKTLNPAKHLRDIVNAEDPTRPVTAGVWTGATQSDFRGGIDIFGLNYGIGGYTKALNHPGNEKLPFLASESSSCISSRGEYFFGTNREGFQISSYDTDHPGWACSPDAEFNALDKNPAFMGEFVWTGFDYIGEPTPYNADLTNLLNIHDKDPVKIAAMKKELEELGKIRCPSRSSYFGIVDLAGFPKDRYYSYQSRWRPDFPMAHIFPHWNWPDRVGQVTPVHVYTSGDEAELFLNGKSLGRKTKAQFEYRLKWDDVKYEPGTLKVVAYKAGKEWATDTVKTTGTAAKLALQADRATIKADGQDLSFVTVRIADAEGLTVPRTHPLVKFQIDGPGEIVAVDNGDATSFEPFQATQHTAYNGLCLAIVRAKSGATGTFTLKATAEGLTDAAILITTQP